MLIERSINTRSQIEIVTERPQINSKTQIKSQRKLELINATLESIAVHGLQNSTIITISQLAGTSSGLISHYFGGKQGLIEATIKHLLEQLKQALLQGTKNIFVLSRYMDPY